MKTITKRFLAMMLTLCLLAVPMIGVSAEDVFDLMPTTEDGYTVVAGDGTVSIENGVLTIVNNSDGDFRLTIDNQTAFDLSKLNTLHMEFHADMPFKMAYHIINTNNVDDNEWLTTSNDYPTLLNVDLTADRAPAGDYNIDMEMCETAVAMTDKSSVCFEQFIILITGKGTFTLNTVEMVTVENDETSSDEPTTEDTDTTTDAPTDDGTTTEAEQTATTTKPVSQADDAQDDNTNNTLLPIILTAIVVVVVIVVVIIIVKKRKS